MTSSFVANLNLNTQDVEEGQLPNYAISHQPPAHFHPPPTLKHHFDHAQHLYPPNDPSLRYQTHSPIQHLPLPPAAHSDIVYQTVKHNHYHKESGYTSETKKKNHKSSHKSARYYHHEGEREKDKEREKARHQRREKEKELYGNDKTNHQREDNAPPDNQNPRNPYPGPPYYPPYMYPPMPMMSPHMPPPHMFSYPLPPPPYMHPNSYPYPPPSMMPPMAMPPPSGYPTSKNNQPYTPNPPVFEKANQPYKGPANERGMREEGVSQKGAENSYKMFGMGGSYMYPYGPPSMGYSPYPPPPYMMYLPPEDYQDGPEHPQREEQLKLSRKKQYIDNQKQKIRKSLKHLPNQQKIQMLQAIRTILKFDNIHSEFDRNHFPPHSLLSESDSSKTHLEAKCLERTLLKVDCWLAQEDDRLRQAMAQLLNCFQLNNVKNKIEQIKAAKAAKLQTTQTQSRRLLSQLIRCPQQHLL